MLGDTLRQAREAKRLTLKDVENSTNIRIHYLEAIEKGDYSQIKGTVYLKGFIRTYAKFLGLDADLMLEKFYSEQNMTKEDPLSNVAPPPVQEPLDQTQVFRPAPPQKPAPSAPRPQPSFTVENAPQKRSSGKKSSGGINLLFGGLIGIIVLACIGYFVWPLFSSPEPKPAPVQQEEQTQPEAAPAPQVKGAHLTATFTKSCWVQVKADGKVIFSQTAKKGQSFTWNAAKDIELRLGNAGAANVSFNGQDLGMLGPDGTVIDKTFTAQVPEEDSTAAPDEQQAEKAAPQRESRPVERTAPARRATSDEQQQNSEAQKPQPQARPEVQAKSEPAPVKKAAAPAAPKAVPTPNSESTKKQ